MRLKINWDALGISASIICAIHCALLPVLLTSLSVFGVNIIENIFFEFGMIILSLIIGIVSLSHGFKKHHHNFLPITLFIFGITFLIFKEIWRFWQFPFLFLAVFLIIISHFINYNLSKKYGHKKDENI
jgi:hypothetical protein